MVYNHEDFIYMVLYTNIDLKLLNK